MRVGCNNNLALVIAFAVIQPFSRAPRLLRAPSIGISTGDGTFAVPQTKCQFFWLRHIDTASISFLLRQLPAFLTSKSRIYSCTRRRVHYVAHKELIFAAFKRFTARSKRSFRTRRSSFRSAVTYALPLFIFSFFPSAFLRCLSCARFRSHFLSHLPSQFVLLVAFSCLNAAQQSSPNLTKRNRGQDEPGNPVVRGSSVAARRCSRPPCGSRTSTFRWQNHPLFTPPPPLSSIARCTSRFGLQLSMGSRRERRLDPGRGTNLKWIARAGRMSARPCLRTRRQNLNGT